MTDTVEGISREEIDTPVTDRFPELSGFNTIVCGDGTHLLGAGLLADGLIVPLFPDEQAATEIVKSLGDDPRDLELRVSALGDPFKAMRKAAGEGAAGFQFSSGLFTDGPSALAVFRLITISYLVGVCTGRSAGFSPLRNQLAMNLRQPAPRHDQTPIRPTRERHDRALDFAFIADVNRA